MGEVMTMEEIERKHDQEWVLLGDTLIGDDDWVTAGRVLFDGKDRDALDERAIALRPKHFAILFVGLPTDAGILIL
jgi:hypothetical protein